MRFLRSALFCGCVLLVLAACSLGGGSSTATSSGSASTATSMPIPTNTTAPTSVPATCASALPSSAPATQPGGANFSDVPVPANTFATALTPFSSGTGLWSIYIVKLCSQGSSTSGIDSFFAAQLPGAGWTQTPKLPFDGGYQQPCGDAYCWAKDTAPRYVGLEKVTDAGNGVTTFQLRLFMPPPTPKGNMGIRSRKCFVSPLLLYNGEKAWLQRTSSHARLTWVC